jgi:hypothetical protein
MRETETAGPSEHTFGRVLRDVRRGERRRRFAFALLPFALVLTTMGAWAATTGRLAALARKIVGPAPAEHQPRASRPREAPAPSMPEIEPIPPPAAVPIVAAAQPEPRKMVPARSRRTDVPAPASTADDLYRRAHEAHFDTGDFSTALALWNDYLAISPPPRFAVEARYNRAITLLRLGRREEASRALRPFAEGDYGSYRSAEARALMRAAEAGPR